MRPPIPESITIAVPRLRALAGCRRTGAGGGAGVAAGVCRPAGTGHGPGAGRGPAAGHGLDCRHREGPRRHSLHCRGEPAGTGQPGAGIHPQPDRRRRCHAVGGTVRQPGAGRGCLGAKPTGNRSRPARPARRWPARGRCGRTALPAARHPRRYRQHRRAPGLPRRGTGPGHARMRRAGGSTGSADLPADPSRRPYYRLEDLPAGDYYLTAFALENNPHRLFGVYAEPLHDCAPGDSRCASTRLQKIQVHPGENRTGIDPDTLLPELPPPLRRQAPGH